MGAPVPVRIEVGPTGRGKILVDGKDISSVVRALTIHAAVGTLTEVTLDLINVETTVHGDASHVFMVGCPKCLQLHRCPAQDKKEPGT